MRTLAIALFVLFALAPSALAQTDCPPGQEKDDNGNCFTLNPTGGTSGSNGNTLGGGTNTNNSTLGGGTNTGTTLINPLKSGTSLEGFLNSILDFVIRIGTIVVILMLVYVGYLFVAAQGAPDKIKEARSALLWTVVGALVLLGAKAISLTIKATVQALGG